MSRLSKKTFIYIILSISLSIILLVIILSVTDKYHISLLDKERSTPIVLYYYHDLDSDGNSEKLFFQKNNNGRVGLIVYENDKVINHWNFEGDWGRNNKPFIGDFDNDGKDEVFLFSRIKDTLYIHCVDPINNKIEFQNKAITKVHEIWGKYDYSIYPGVLYDMDYDGVKEIYFSINTGYSTKPRNLFVYNFLKDTILKSPESCTPMFLPIAYDFDDDTVPELFCSTNAFGNCDFSRKYSDQYSWLMVFNPDLSFKFDPIPFNIYPSTTRVGIINEKDNFVFVFNYYVGIEKHSSLMALVNSKGLMCKTKYLNEDFKSSLFEIINDPLDYSFIYLINKTGEVFKIDASLNIKRHSRIPELSYPNNYYKFDIDNDGRDEYIFSGKLLNKFIITRHDFRNAISVSLEKRKRNISLFSLKQENSVNTQLCLDTEEYFYHFSYGKALVHNYWYFFLVINTIFIYLIFYIVTKIKEYRKLKIKDTQRKISELQIKSFQNQIDPHFTFNLLESFGSLIHEHNTEKANFIFINYTKLLKSTIINSDRVFIPLKEELDFVKSYLDLEMFRYNNKFSYQINVCDEECGQIIIPKMLVHIFAENSIKHGIKHLEGNGKLDINGYRKNGTFIIQVIDNGVGRKKAKEYASFSTGKGLESINQILDLYYNLYKIKINYQINDLEKDSKPLGTQVDINIPLKVKL